MELMGAVKIAEALPSTGYTVGLLRSLSEYCFRAVFTFSCQYCPASSFFSFNP
jgi:hypothetical protein